MSVWTGTRHAWLDNAKRHNLEKDKRIASTTQHSGDWRIPTARETQHHIAFLGLFWRLSKVTELLRRIAGSHLRTLTATLGGPLTGAVAMNGGRRSKDSRQRHPFTLPAQATGA